MILLTQCKREQLQRDEKSFIRKVTGAPELRCVLGYNWLIEDLIICCTNPQSLCVLGVDPTFNLGRFNVTVTTFRKLKVTDNQPRKPGSLPTHGAAGKTLVGAGHVILSNIHYLMGWGKYQIACFHMQVIHFKCKERDLIVFTDNINFLV